MPNVNLPALIGGVACVIGIAAYHKSCTLETDVSRPTLPVALASDSALEQRVSHLEALVAQLEQRISTVPAGAKADNPVVAELAARDIVNAGSGREDASSPSIDAPQRAEHMRRVTATVDAYWREWGATHGLSASQIDGVAQLEVAAAKRKLDNQANMIDGSLTQAAVRADNQVATEDVRRTARALLTADQFIQFEKDHGADWGSSYRKVREAHAKAAASNVSPSSP